MEQLNENALVLRADLDGLHSRLGLGAGLVDAVADNRRGGHGRLLVDDGALLRRGVPNDVEFRCLRERASGGESDDDA